MLWFNGFDLFLGWELHAAMTAIHIEGGVANEEQMIVIGPGVAPAGPA